MSATKLILLAVYAVLIFLAVTQGDSSTGIWSLRILVLLAVVHFIETLVYFKLCKAAAGSLAGHLVSVFLFGVLHVNELKAQRGAR